MVMERKILIAYMLGFIDRDKKGLPKQDKLILLDQSLIAFNQPPVTPEEKLEFLQELALEIDASLMLAKINRKTTRDLALGRR